MACCGSAVGKNVWALKNMEIESQKRETEKLEKPETKKPKLMTDNKVVEVEYDDGDVSPDVLYDRNSTNDVPEQLFTDLAELGIDYFRRKYPHRPCTLLHVDKVTSVLCCGVEFTLTMTAKRATDDDVQTFESKIWSKGGLAKSRVLYTHKLSW